MQRLGLDYDTLSRDNPRLVMASITSNGQTGPLRDLRAYAPSIGAMSGLDSTMGYEPAEGETGRPLGLKHAYADLTGALHAVFAIVSALHERKSTGVGPPLLDVATCCGLPWPPLGVGLDGMN